MKKRKDKPQKKADMPEFSFKEFTAEESAIYEEAMSKFRAAITAGKPLKQVYESYPIADPELSSLIQADFLKIQIAERHFGQRQTLDEMSKALDVSPDLLKNTLARMLQEVGITAANQFGHKFGEVVPKTND
jgi:hypothetical protein